MSERGPIFTLLPGRLYLSGTWHKMSPERRRAEIYARCITDVVNLGKLDPAWDEYGLRYTYVKAPDSFKVVPHEALGRAADVVAAALRLRHVTLVMCLGGRNRSAAVAALGLMRADGYSADEAVALIKSVKPTTFLNPLTLDWLREQPRNVKGHVNGW